MGGLPAGALPQLLTSLVEAMVTSPHLEYLLHWARELLQTQGPAIERMPASLVAPSIRLLRQALSRMRSDIGSACTSNLYHLQYLSQAGLTDQASVPNGGLNTFANEEDSVASDDSKAELGSIEQPEIKRKDPTVDGQVKSAKKKAKREPIHIKLTKPA